MSTVGGLRPCGSIRSE